MASTNAGWRLELTNRLSNVDAALTLGDLVAADAADTALIKLTRAVKFWRWWLASDPVDRTPLETEWDAIVQAGG